MPTKQGLPCFQEGLHAVSSSSALMYKTRCIIKALLEHLCYCSQQFKQQFKLT